MTDKKVKTSTDTKKGRFREAERRYRDLWEGVKPYVKRRRLIRHSTRGEWKTPG